MATAGLVLAAGAGRRFGGPKALAALDGELLVERAVRLLRSAGCDPVLAVIGAGAEDVRDRSSGIGCEWVVAEDWAEGMSAGLRAGLRAVGRTYAAAACVVLVDQPHLDPAAVRRVLEAATDPAVTVAQAHYDGRPGHPVVFARPVWDEVTATLAGDEGARRWLARHREQVTAVACDGLGSDRDVDRPGDISQEAPGIAE